MYLYKIAKYIYLDLRMQSQTGNPHEIRLQSGRQLKWAFQIRASVHGTQLTFAEQKKAKKGLPCIEPNLQAAHNKLSKKILLSLIDQSGTKPITNAKQKILKV